MDSSHPSLTEYAVLGVLAEGPSHGFALSKQLGPDGEVGRVLTVRRPLVYRALDRLVDAGLAEPVHTEKGDAGPQRVVHRITARGRRRLRRWLGEPVEHIRDMRIEFLLKLALLRRAGSSPLTLVRAQRATLDPTLTALDDPDAEQDDHVELWRQHNAAAAAAYLQDLEVLYRRN
ncbi:MAG: PadR family transcriptional regulator [Acidimicrobiia bacterium]